MKNLIKKALMVGAILAGGLGLFGQEKQNSIPSMKEIKKELGTESFLDLRTLGHGYVTLREKGLQDNNFYRLKSLEGISRGSVKIENNGKRIFMEGEAFGDISKATMEDIDSNKDYILTPREISLELGRKYQKAFSEYSSNILGVPEEEIMKLEEGYVTSKNLVEKLNILSEIYEKRFEHERKELYDMISGEDKVVTEKEIVNAANIIRDYLK